MSKWVWIIGGGEMSLPAIREAKRRGYKVIVSDGNKDAIGMKEADLPLVIDTYDEDNHERVAWSLWNGELPVVGVLCSGADIGPTVSAIAAVWDLPAASRDAATKARDKIKMRETLQLTHPRFTTAYEHRWVWDIFPCVVKPANNCATRGVSLVQQEQDLLSAVQCAAASNKYMRESIALIEELLSGEEHALDFFIVNGKAVWVNGTTRLYRTHILGIKQPLFGIEAAAINPWQPPQEVIDLATDAAGKLGVTEGPFKMDVLRDERYGWCILETATRLSGGYDHAFMAPLVGKDITGLLLDYSIGVQLTEDYIHEKTQWNGKYACFYVPYYKLGKIDGWEYVRGRDVRLIVSDGVIPQLQYVFIRSDTEIAPLKTCADRPIYIIATGHSPINALRNAGRARKYIQPNYKDGHVLPSKDGACPWRCPGMEPEHPRL